jgi:hypothetical protein
MIRILASSMEVAQRAPSRLRSSAGQKAPFTRRCVKLWLALMDPVAQRGAFEGVVVSFFSANGPTPHFSAVKLNSHVN